MKDWQKILCLSKKSKGQIKCKKNPTNSLLFSIHTLHDYIILQRLTLYYFCVQQVEEIEYIIIIEYNFRGAAERITSWSTNETCDGIMLKQPGD